MVYAQKMVVCVVPVKNGSPSGIAREIRIEGTDQVFLPYGTDYLLRFRNMHSRRAVVSVEVDGDDALDGSRLVLGAGEEGELEGFMEGSTVHKMFRFIEKTAKISKHRGDRMEDGLIRISFQFEKPPRPRPPYRPLMRRRRGWEDDIILRDSVRSMEKGPASYSAELGVADLDYTPEIQTSGITVPGADTNQHFRSVHVGPLEPEEHVIVLQLLGEKSDGEEVVQPLLTRKKYRCPTCGAKNSSRAKFCPDCGTNLT